MSGSSRDKWYWRPSYLGFSIGCAAAWAVIWILLATLASTRTVHAVAYVFLGWVIGWFTATLARVVYPAPRRTVLTAGPRGRAQLR
jgi:hypothetical protein